MLSGEMMTLGWIPRVESMILWILETFNDPRKYITDEVFVHVKIIAYKTNMVLSYVNSFLPGDEL